MSISVLPAGVFILWLFSNSIIGLNVPPIVSISSGQLLGKTSLSRDGRLFNSFLGIPYALPPIQTLRFEVIWTQNCYKMEK